MKQMEITISPTGETVLETKGFSGPECREASAFLEAALGTRAAERLASEFYLPQSVSQSLPQQN